MIRHDDDAWRPTECSTDATTPEDIEKIRTTTTLHDENTWRTSECSSDATATYARLKVKPLITHHDEKSRFPTVCCTKNSDRRNEETIRERKRLSQTRGWKGESHDRQDWTYQLLTKLGPHFYYGV